MTDTNSQNIDSLPSGINLNGVWVSDAFGEIRLEYNAQQVAGSYTGRGGGILMGNLQGNRLNFTWQDNQLKPNSAGWGFLRAIAGARTLVGLWGYDKDKTTSESMIAEFLRRCPGFITPDLSLQDKMDLKYTGYDLVLHGRYEQALPLLEKALELYKEESEKDSVTTDAYLIDQMRIFTNILECYFGLADYSGLPVTSTIGQQRQVFYDRLLEHLGSAVDTYQRFLQRTFQRHTITPIKELTSAASSMKHWQEQLITQIAVLEQKQTHELDQRIPDSRFLLQH